MPSMSNANTNESSGGTSPRVTGVPGVAGAGAGNESASRLTVASSSPACSREPQILRRKTGSLYCHESWWYDNDRSFY